MIGGTDCNNYSGSGPKPQTANYGTGVIQNVTKTGTDSMLAYYTLTTNSTENTWTYGDLTITGPGHTATSRYKTPPASFTGTATVLQLATALGLDDLTTCKFTGTIVCDAYMTVNDQTAYVNKDTFNLAYIEGVLQNPSSTIYIITSCNTSPTTANIKFYPINYTFIDHTPGSGIEILSGGDSYMGIGMSLYSNNKVIFKASYKQGAENTVLGYVDVPVGSTITASFYFARSTTYSGGNSSYKLYRNRSTSEESGSTFTVLNSDTAYKVKVMFMSGGIL